MPLTAVSTTADALVVTWSLPAPPESVWAGWSDPALLAQWLGRPIECDLEPGGRLVIDHGDGYLSCSTVTDVERDRRVGMTWTFPDEPESRIVIELRPGEAGTELELAHRDLGSGLVDSYAPGWITHLTFLEAAVAGTPLPLAHFWQLYATVDSLLTRRP